MYEVNNPANATEITSVNELNHLRAVNAELLEALNNFSACAKWYRQNQDSPMSELGHFMDAVDDSIAARSRG